MDKVYLILLTIAAVLLLIDSFAGAPDRKIHTRLLPLALFFWVLVPWLQIVRSI